MVLQRGGLSEEDLLSGAAEKRITVEIEFYQITDDDRQRLGKYAVAGRDSVSIWKAWEDGREKLYGRGRACPQFADIRQGANATERRQRYGAFRSENPDFDLPTAASDAMVQTALDQWELDHPDELQDVDIESASHLFGFAGQAVMSGLFDFAFVTADLRAGEQVQDSRSAIVGRILEQTAHRSFRR